MNSAQHEREALLKFGQPFIEVVASSFPLTRADRRSIEQYTMSIDHKLNVARRSLRLIERLQPGDFNDHLDRREGKSPPRIDPTKIEYQHYCVYYAYDWDQFSLAFLSFIDDFCGAIFSLFDTVGHLINTLYNLELASHKIDYKSVIIELDKRGIIKFVAYLAKFVYIKPDKLSLATPVVHNQWALILRAVRNRMMHSRMTEVAHLIRPTPPDNDYLEIRLETLIQDSEPVKENLVTPKNADLAWFMTDCFAELNAFLTQLFNYLSEQVQKEQQIPLDGKYDDDYTFV